MDTGQMQTQQKIKTSILFVIALCLFAWVSPTHAQTYSKDIADMQWSITNVLPFFSHKEANETISPIGDLGDVLSVIDLRGFIPVSTLSKDKIKHFDFFQDRFQWYQYQTDEGVALFYYGDTDEKTLERLSNTTFLTEDKLSGEDLEWAKLAYSLTKTSGKELYKSVTGDSDLDGAEPIVLLFTARSTFILINFKYSSWDRKGTGQALTAFEFSRFLKEYKAFYNLHSTTIFNRSMRATFEDSMPIVLGVLKHFFLGLR